MMKTARFSPAVPCPCGSDETYTACCGHWHAGLAEGVHAPSPEALMRSRYSAFVRLLGDYLLATWHPSTSPGELELPPVKWLGLEVRHSEAAGDAGVVELWPVAVTAAAPSASTRPAVSCARTGAGSTLTAWWWWTRRAKSAAEAAYFALGRA